MQARVIPKRAAQPLHDRQQDGDIGGVTWHHLGADRAAIGIDDDGEDHLVEIRAMVLGIAPCPQRLAAFAVEGQGGRVHEDDGEIGKQVAPRRAKTAPPDHVS